jgi:hypothetical protein
MYDKYQENSSAINGDVKKKSFSMCIAMQM